MFYGFIPAVAPAAAAGASSVLAHANEKLMPMLARVAQLAEGDAAPGQHQSRVASFFTASDILQATFRLPPPHSGKESETISQPKRR